MTETASPATGTRTETRPGAGSARAPRAPTGGRR